MKSLTKKELIDFFLEKGILVTPDLLESAQNKSREELSLLCQQKGLLVLNKEVSQQRDIKEGVDWKEVEKGMVGSDRGEKDVEYLNDLKKPKIEDVQVLFSYEESGNKPTVQDFCAYFNNRLEAIEAMLATRKELQKLMSINKILQKKERESISLIGMIQDIVVTKNGNILLTLEDTTGVIKVLIHKNHPELLTLAKNLVLDEVIGINGVTGKGIVFCNTIIQPDIPLTKEFKKGREEDHVIFLSDLHVGSTYFLEGAFKKFLGWINQESGSETQKELAKKVKYIFIIGDLIDGVGIYPNQESELKVPDVREQYQQCAELLSKIPEHIQVIICGGNHDALRLSEPQPPLSKDYAKPIWELPHVTMVSNPSYVRIGANEEFQGFDVLLYHGYSFDYYIAQVDSIRNSGGYDRADLIMKFLLQKRHLAPSHTSTLYIPDKRKDYLVIDRVPDFFVTGHIHKTSVSQYRNVTLICGSCWQSTTSFQEKLGHHPEPCRVPIVNLKNRQVKVLRFEE